MSQTASQETQTSTDLSQGREKIAGRQKARQIK